MKNSKKCDFKKLALLGITGGAVFATQAVEANPVNPSELLASNACGTVNGCSVGGQGMGNSGGGYQAYRSMPSQDAYYYNGGQSYASCGGASPQYYPSSSSCGGAAMPQYYQSSPHYYQQSNYPTNYPSAPSYNSASQNQSWSGCGGATPQNYQAHAAQPTQGCGGAAPASGQTTNQPMATAPSAPSAPAADQNNNWSQWETADNAKTMQNKPSMMQDSGSMMQEKRGSQKQMTEDELLSQLNEDGKRTFNSLDAAGKALAIKMASLDTFKDKNLAVKAAALKMSEKRAAPASSKY